MKRKRLTYITTQQREQLVNILNADSQLRSGKFSAQFTYQVAKLRWQNISEILNSMPGAKKDWKLWRKTWQDLKSRSKKQYVPRPTYTLTNEVLEVRPVKETNIITDETSSQQNVFLPIKSQCTQQSSTVKLDDPLLSTMNISMKEEPPVMQEESESESESELNDLQTATLNNTQPKETADNCEDINKYYIEEKLKIKQQLLRIKKKYYNDYIREMRRQTDALIDIANALK